MNFMRYKLPAIFLVFILSVSTHFSAPRIKEKDLPEKYREWLKLTRYIILPKEKEVLIQLTSDRDRDIFINAFWKQRDQTPGTPQNEYKDEHMRRFIYANTKLKRSTPREGWMTDMGRIHILLGPPHSIERFDVQAGIHPCQVWYYYGDKEKGLPAYFAIVFFQRSGSGEYKLYNPAADGPRSLLVESERIGLNNYQKAYEKIRELAPSLAEVSVTMIPGELPFNYIPSPRNNIIIAHIFKSPKKDVSPTYATHFLNYKGVVSTEYLTNYIESVAETVLIIDPILNISFLHFSISPKSVSIDYFEPKDQYYCNFQLNVSLRKKDDLVFQYSKDFPFYFSPDDIDQIKGNGISIQDSFPIIEGEYALNVLIQNSVGKEFSVFEEDISIPKEPESAKIIGPVLGFELLEHSGHFHVPFRVMNKKLGVDPNKIFSSKEEMTVFFNVMNAAQDLWQEGKVEVSINGLSDKNPTEKSFDLDLKNYPYDEILSIIHSISSRELLPDYYEMKLTLQDGKQAIIDEKVTEFIVSPKETIPHPVTLAKSFPLSNSYLYFYSLAYQYDKVNEREKAEAAYEKAYSSNPEYRPGLVEYAGYLLKMKKPNKSLTLIEGIKEDEESKFDFYLIKGLAYLEMGKYSVAIDNFLESNKIYDSDIRLLNALGFCYYKTDQKEKALDVLKASLSLNPDQKDIKKLIKEIK